MYLVILYKIVNVSVFLYLIVFEIPHLKLVKMGDEKTKNSYNLSNFKKDAYILLI